MHIKLHWVTADFLEVRAATPRAALRLHAAREKLERKVLLPMSLESAARLANMEPTYFSRAFKKQIGVGFASWVRQTRVSCAKDLLRGSATRITDIALVCGFSDMSTFERTFRQLVGITPRQYRNQAQRIDAISSLTDYHAGF